MDTQTLPANPPTKTPVPRGARACTVCRQAKMKCVGAEDGTKRCQRCQRSGAECIFEKHRRGRKPGSKLSEASKMLRRLEKGLNNAKAKQPTNPAHAQASTSPTHFGQDDASGSSSLINNASHSGHQSDEDMDEDEDDRPDDAIYPANAIRKSHIRCSFLDVVMNKDPAQQSPPHSASPVDRASHPPPKAASQSPTRSYGSPQPCLSGLYSNVPKDPVEAGIIAEADVSMFFDLFFLRLNPFINLFDPALHSPEYVRQRSPFLFTTMLMACCKFFRPASYQRIRRLAQDWCTFSFAEGRESVETVQALACMTYWKEPADRRTWTYIGMACRMAVGLRLNRYVGPRQPTETDMQMRERRNRERTYLVLFVHDRSLSMQTGKHWMLPEDELVHRSREWHKEGALGPRSETRPEDVIVAAFVNLRLIGSEATDIFNNRKSMFDHELLNINSKLDGWLNTWLTEMHNSSLSDPFHHSFLHFFQSHVRLFLNTFGLNMMKVEMSRTLPNAEAVLQCYRSATTNLQIASENFADTNVLRYGQESVFVMSAYAAIVLLKLFRNPSTVIQLGKSAEDIYAVINKTADAYQNAGHVIGSELVSAAYHARFLRRLTAIEQERTRQQPERNGFRSDGIPPSFAQGLPPLRASQPAMGVPTMSSMDSYSISRMGLTHNMGPPQLPPITIPGSSSQSGHAFSSGHVDYMDSSMRTGLAQSVGRAGPSYSSQNPTESDESYFNYMYTEASELITRGDGTPPTAVGFMGNNGVTPEYGYPQQQQTSYRDPPQISAYGAQNHGRTNSYQPPMPSYTNGYDVPR